MAFKQRSSGLPFKEMGSSPAKQREGSPKPTPSPDIPSPSPKGDSNLEQETKPSIWSKKGRRAIIERRRRKKIQKNVKKIVKTQTKINKSAEINRIKDQYK